MRKKPAAKKAGKKKTTKKPAATKASKKGSVTKAAKKAAKKVAKKAKKVTRKKVEAVPSRYGTVTPHLIVSPCKEAMDFYARAFGAKLLPAMEGPGGVVMHAEMKVGDSMVMLSDEMPPMPGERPWRKTPNRAGATTGGIMLYVKDVDAAYERAVAAGAKGVMPPADMFWGDRYGQVEDPYGHVWAMATHVRDVSMKEMSAAMQQAGPPA